MSLLSSEQHNSMLDELMSTNTSDVRKAKIMSELMNNNDNVHKMIQEKDTNYSKLEEQSKELVDVNRKMMTEMFSGSSPKSFGKEKTFSESVTIENMERLFK